jgi:hypothetical protein
LPNGQIANADGPAVKADDHRTALPDRASLHDSDVVARMLLYTVVMRLTDAPVSQLRDAVTVVLSGLTAHNGPRRR